MLSFFRDNGLSPDKRAVWRDNQRLTPSAQPSRPKGPTPPPIGWNVGGVAGPCPASCWPPDGMPVAKPGPLPVPDLYADRVPGYEAACQMPSLDLRAQDSPECERHNAKCSQNNRQGSKSLPSSPVKNKVMPFWRHEFPPFQDNNQSSSEALKRATSFPNTRSTNSSPNCAKKTRYHHGNLYMEVDDDGPFEKETVLWASAFHGPLLETELIRAWISNYNHTKQWGVFIKSCPYFNYGYMISRA